MKLTIIRGICGSGKTTLAKTNYQCLHVETDMLCMVDGQYQWSGNMSSYRHRIAHELVEKVLASGSDVVVSNTFTRKWELQPYIDLATKYGATLEIIKMSKEYGSVHNVPASTIQAMKDRWEDIEGEIVV